MSLIPMKNQRLILHNQLSSISGVKKVYYQPPMSSKLVYPCIIYSFNDFSTSQAANDDYLRFPTYTVTVIDFDVESDIPERLFNTKGDFLVSFDRFFTADNLNHWSFSLVMTKGTLEE